MSRWWAPASAAGEPTASTKCKGSAVSPDTEVTMMASLPLVPRWPVTAASECLGVGDLYPCGSPES